MTRASAYTTLRACITLIINPAMQALVIVVESSIALHPFAVAGSLDSPPFRQYLLVASNLALASLLEQRASRQKQESTSTI